VPGAHGWRGATHSAGSPIGTEFARGCAGRGSPGGSWRDRRIVPDRPAGRDAGSGSNRAGRKRAARHRRQGAPALLFDGLCSCEAHARRAPARTTPARCGMPRPRDAGPLGIYSVPGARSVAWWITSARCARRRARRATRGQSASQRHHIVGRAALDQRQDLVGDRLHDGAILRDIRMPIIDRPDRMVGVVQDAVHRLSTKTGRGHH
jgi:hypothetical protein